MHPGPDRSRCAAGRCLAAVLLLCTATPVRPAPVDDVVTPGAGGALVVSADPAELVLGRDATAELRISAPAEVEEVSVTASAGKVEGLRRLPGGGFTARYRPPPERYPQVAIVAALARTAAGTLDGWRALPLAGQGDAKVPGEPGTDVSLRIGDRSFGPGHVGSDGIALIPVVVPPGVREGYQGLAAVDLLVPETTLVHAAVDRPAVQADRPETVRVFAYVVAPHGAARGGDAPLVEVTRGTLALQPREPGAWVGSWTLPSGPPGEERATVRLPGLPASKAVLRVAVQPGPAASIGLTLDRSTLRAGEPEEVRITARALDVAGNPTAAAPVLSADAGSLVQEEGAPGLSRARLRVEPRYAGRERVLVTARVPGTGAWAVQPVTLAPGPAASAVLAPARTTLRPDGRSDTLLTLEAWDAFQNPVAGSPRVEASTGTATLAPAGPGRWVVHYRSEPVVKPTQARLVAELGDARDQSELLLLPRPSAEMAFLAAGGGLAGVSNGVSGGQLLAGAELPVPQWLHLPADGALGLRVEVAGIQGSHGVAGGAQNQTSALLLAGPALKGFLPRARWFASGTLGLAAGTTNGPAGSHAGTGLAARLGLGLAVPVRGTAPFLELGFLGAGGPAAVEALTLSVGVRFDVSRGGEAGSGG